MQSGGRLARSVMTSSHRVLRRIATKKEIAVRYDRFDRLRSGQQRGEINVLKDNLCIGVAGMRHSHSIIDLKLHCVVRSRKP